MSKAERTNSVVRYDATLERVADEIGMIAQIEFIHHVGAMYFHCAWADKKPLADCCVSVPFSSSTANWTANSSHSG
jgi:hypothetical protein